MSGGPAAAVRVDEARLTGLVEQLARVGAQPGGGIIRPLYSPAWREAQDMVAAFMADAGFDVREDAVGNVQRRRLRARPRGFAHHVLRLWGGAAFAASVGVASLDRTSF